MCGVRTAYDSITCTSQVRSNSFSLTTTSRYTYYTQDNGAFHFVMDLNLNWSSPIWTPLCISIVQQSRADIFLKGVEFASNSLSYWRWWLWRAEPVWTVSLSERSVLVEQFLCILEDVVEAAARPLIVTAVKVTLLLSRFQLVGVNTSVLLNSSVPFQLNLLSKYYEL